MFYVIIVKVDVLSHAKHAIQNLGKLRIYHLNIYLRNIAISYMKINKIFILKTIVLRYSLK